MVQDSAYNRGEQVMRTTVVVLAPLAWVGLASAQVTERVSVDTNGLQVAFGGDLPSPPRFVVSSDGRHIAFVSAAQMDPGDTNGTWDVFVRDRLSGTTERVSVSSSGAQGNGVSGLYAIGLTPDARFVVFDSSASNLVAGDTNGFRDVFVRDRVAATTERISVSGSGLQGNAACFHSAITPDGRYVAFESLSSNLVAGDVNGSPDVFVHDRVAGATEIVSIATSGAQGDGYSETPAISSDGRFVAFDSVATTLVPGDSNGRADVFLRDRLLGVTTLVSLSTSGLQTNLDSASASISDDGRYVAFASMATNLVANDTNGSSDIFIRDVQAGTTERASVGPGGVQANYSCSTGFISPSGSVVVFQSGATSFGFNVLGSQIWLRDLQAGTTELVSTATGGAYGLGASGMPTVTADGRYVAFRSAAPNLVPGDTNGNYDVFIHDRFSARFASVCDAGQGGVVACPCANPPSGTGRGCDNSSGTGGAVLGASGIAYLSMDSLVFTASGEKPIATSILLQSDTAVPAGLPFGQGVRCLGGVVERLYMKSAVGGAITAPEFAAGDLTVSARSAQLGMTIQPGQALYYLVYYRDPIVLGGCAATSTFNATQTGSIAYWP